MGIGGMGDILALLGKSRFLTFARNGHNKGRKKPDLISHSDNVRIHTFP